MPFRVNKYVRAAVLPMPRESNTIESWLGGEPPSMTVTPRAVFRDTALETLMFVPFA